MINRALPQFFDVSLTFVCYNGPKRKGEREMKELRNAMFIIRLFGVRDGMPKAAVFLMGRFIHRPASLAPSRE